MATKMEQLCDLIIATRQERDEIKAKLEACEKGLDKAEGDLVSALAEGEGKCSYGGFSFSSAIKVNWKTLKDEKDKLVALLKKGVPELVQETVNAASLTAYLRKNETVLEAEGPNWWPKARACLERSEVTSLSVRKSATKKKK